MKTGSKRSKRLTFKQALEKVKSIAEAHGHNYFALKYEVTQKENTLRNVGCWVYVHDADWFIGTSWEDAIRMLEEHYSHRDPHKFTLLDAPGVADKDAELQEM